MRDSCTCKFLEQDFLKLLNYSHSVKIKLRSPIDIVAVPHIIYIIICVLEVRHTHVHALALVKHLTTSSVNMVFFNPRLCIILKTPCSVRLCGQIGYTVIRIVSILVRTSRVIITAVIIISKAHNKLHNILM